MAFWLQEWRELAMTILENTETRLKSRSTTLTLDKTTRKVALQRKVLFWEAKTLEAPLTEIAGVSVDSAVDRASGVEFCSTMVIFRAGQGWALPAADKDDAQANAAAIRKFLNMSEQPYSW
jgi:hypothetical protein